MKGISGTMLGLAFVLYSLFSLVSVNRTWDSRSAPLEDRDTRVSELGLRIDMQW
jgi:hypothetical protein